MSQSSSNYTEADVIGALRLAVQGAGDSETLRSVIVEILPSAPATPSGNTESVRLFIEAVKAAGATYEVVG